MTYKGEIGGIGNSSTRENEITPDIVATYRYFVTGHKSGVIASEGHELCATVDGYTGAADSDGEEKYSNTIHVEDGMVFAYGYFAKVEAQDFTFLPPAVEQWHIIYVRLDKSVIPNTCTIKTKNNQLSSRILANTFRQDELSVVKTGVYELPLWIIRVTNKGIRVENLEGTQYDLRDKQQWIKSVVKSDYTGGVTKKIANNVTCATQASGTNDSTVASRKFAQEEIIKAINA